MARYTVAVPITGVIYVEVEADDEAGAKVAALESDGLTLDNVEEWNTHRQVVQGNVFYGTQNAVEITETWEED